MDSINKQWQKVQRTDKVEEYFMLGEFVPYDVWERCFPLNVFPTNYPYLKDCIKFDGKNYGIDIMNEIRVTELTHVTTCENMLSIIKDGGFKPKTKTIPGIGNMDLVWFGIKIGETEIDCVREKYKWSANNLLQYGLPMSTVDRCTSHFACAAPFQPMSRYGNFKFTFSIREVLQEYKHQFCFSQGNLNIRKLGTFAYKMETMHVILICPPDTYNADKCPLLFDDHIIQPDENFETWIWRPYSTGDQSVFVTPSGRVSNYYKRWEHVVFAFYVRKGVCLKIDNLKDHLSLCVWQDMKIWVHGMPKVSCVTEAIDKMFQMMASEKIYERKLLANILIRMIRGYLDEKPLYQKTIDPVFLSKHVDMSIDLGWVSGELRKLLQIEIAYLNWSPLIAWIHSVTGLTNLPDFFNNL